jgi:hypothetical protein
MFRKDHLQHTVHYGPTCQSGRSGGSLRGEHITLPAAEFLALAPELRCVRCASSKLFAFLKRQADKQAATDWQAEAPDAWKAADDALIAQHRAARLASGLEV